MKFKKIVSLLTVFLMFFCFSSTELFADVTLPDGAVVGLPEKITVMDSSGKSVNSESGEYFFSVQNMNFGEVYTKDIQIMNLRDDKAYRIYFYVEPKPESKKGEIDLEQGCVCSFFFDNELFYQGTVSGVGTIDLTKEAKELGYYEPGDSHKLTCSIAWVNQPGEFLIDEGHRIVDKTGTWILTPKSGTSSIKGEIEFKWVFCASVDEEYVPPNTGLFATDGTIWIICIIAAAVMTGIMFILLAFKNKKNKKNKKTQLAD